MVEHLKVSPEEDGLRLDVWISNRFAVGRNPAKECIAAGYVKTRSKVMRKGDTVHAGEVITIDRIPTSNEFEPIAVDVEGVKWVYVDDEVVVAEKPAHVASHPLRADEQSTLANALAKDFPECVHSSVHLREAGLIHRLDIGTSGLLIAARNQEAYQKLIKDLREGRIQKEYTAIVSGIPKIETIDAPIGWRGKHAERVEVVLDDRDYDRLHAREARTEIVEVHEHGQWHRVIASVDSATRHQVRVHLAHVGHPLVGDSLYGGVQVDLLTRHALHASKIVFVHPVDQKKIEVVSELPGDLKRLKEIL